MTPEKLEQIIRVLKSLGLDVKRINMERPLKEIARELKARGK